MERYFYEDLENVDAVTVMAWTKILDPGYELMDNIWQDDEAGQLYTTDKAAYQWWQDFANAQALVDDYEKNELKPGEYIKYPDDGDVFTLAQHIENGEDISAYVTVYKDLTNP